MMTTTLSDAVSERSILAIWPPNKPWRVSKVKKKKKNYPTADEMWPIRGLLGLLGGGPEALTRPSTARRSLGVVAANVAPIALGEAAAGACDQ